MKNENLIAVEAIAAKTTAPASFKCPENCMMGGALCEDCRAYDFTKDWCDYHNTSTTAKTYACPAYYYR